MTNRLENYLRTFRKRSGLTQSELAFLTGCRNGSRISRYEWSRRQPNLQVAFLYELIFNVPARELFAGCYEDAEKQLKRRARLLGLKLSKSSVRGPRIAFKIRFLKAIAEPEGCVSEEPSLI